MVENEKLEDLAHDEENKLEIEGSSPNFFS